MPRAQGVMRVGGPCDGVTHSSFLLAVHVAVSSGVIRMESRRTRVHQAHVCARQAPSPPVWAARAGFCSRVKFFLFFF